MSGRVALRLKAAGEKASIGSVWAPEARGASGGAGISIASGKAGKDAN